MKKPPVGAISTIIVRPLFPLLLLLIPVPAGADRIALSPPAAQVQFRTYGLGLLPLDGKFTRFHGWMRYDPGNPTACQIVLEVEASSLAMDSDTIRTRITGPDFMDADRFPDISFNGACQGNAVTGSLTLHGETHPLSFEIQRPPSGLVFIGRLKRTEWGITAHPLMGGSTIRIRVEIPDLPPGSHT